MIKEFNWYISKPLSVCANMLYIKSYLVLNVNAFIKRDNAGNGQKVRKRNIQTNIVTVKCVESFNLCFLFSGQ